MKVSLLLLLISFGSAKCFSQYDKNIRLIDSIENKIYDRTKPSLFYLNVIDSGNIKSYSFYDSTNEIHSADVMNPKSGKRILIFYTPGGSIRKIMLWLLDENLGDVTTQYYFKDNTIFYVNGIYLKDEDLSGIKKLAKDEYETAEIVLKNKDQVQKNFDAWRKKTYTDNPDFKDPEKK
ncbi:MAG: hypothetical protein ACRDE8_14975 [Ginsengibacter sp.]